MNSQDSLSPDKTTELNPTDVDVTESTQSNGKLPWRLIILGMLAILGTLAHPTSRNLILEQISSLETATEATPVETETNPVVAKALPVGVLTVTPVTRHQESRRYSGNIVIKRSSELGFEQSGKLVSLFVQEGQFVSKGTLIGVLDTNHLQVQKQELLAQRSQATAQLQELEAGPRSQTIFASQAKVRDLQAQLALAEAKYQRRKDLLEAGAISREQLDEVRTDVNAQTARVDEAQSQLDELLAGTRPEQIALQKSVVAQYDAQIARIDLDVQKSQLKAPYSGTIAQRHVNIGTVISSGQAIVRLVEDSSLEARIGVPAETATRLSIGSTHRLKIGERSVVGKVTSILPQVDTSTRTATVILTLNQTQGIRSGQIVSLELSDSIPLSGYWLPTGALIEGTRGLWSSYILGEPDPNNPRRFSVQRKDVEIISIEGDRVLVRGTLSPGDRVITEGVHRLVPGQMVEVW